MNLNKRQHDELVDEAAKATFQGAGVIIGVVLFVAFKAHMDWPQALATSILVGTILSALTTVLVWPLMYEILGYRKYGERAMYMK